MLKIKNILIILLLLISVASFSADIKGNVDSIDLNNKKLNVIANNKTYTLDVTAQSKLLRGLVGTAPLEVDMLSISPGDAITCSYDDNNKVTKATLTFNIIKGTIAKIDNNTITLVDGTTCKVSPKVSISLLNGKKGSISNLEVGHTFVARTNPNNGEIWTLVVSGKEKIDPKSIQTKPVEIKTEPKEEKKPEVVKPKEEKKPEVSQPKQEPKQEKKETPSVKPATTPVAKTTPSTPKAEVVPVAPVNNEIEITNIIISAPKEIMSGDMVLVEVQGTPHCGVSCDIQYVKDTKQKLNEDTAGVYRGFITIPFKDLNGAKFVAYMSYNGKNISKICDTILYVKGKTAKLQTIVKTLEEVPTTKTEEPKQENISNTENTETPKDATVEETNTELAPADSDKKPEKKESEQLTDTKEINDQITNKDSITDPLKSATIKVDDIKIVSPENDATVNNIAVSGLAIPGKKINIKTIYSNGKYGVLGIRGILHEDTIEVREDGVFNYGPIELTDFFATPGLIYYIELTYADDETFPAKIIRVIKQ